jgi:ubiquitin thioesterase protein OTUB1
MFFIRFHDLAAKSKENLVALGFPQFTVEDFHDTVSKTGGCDGVVGGSGDDDDDASYAP